MPLVIVTLCNVGWLAKRSAFLITGIIVYVLTSALILGAFIAVGLSRGHGSTESGGWDNMTILYIWLVAGIILLIVGYRTREPIKLGIKVQVGSSSLKTLRELESDEPIKMQNKMLGSDSK